MPIAQGAPARIQDRFEKGCGGLQIALGAQRCRQVVLCKQGMGMRLAPALPIACDDLCLEFPRSG